MNIEHGNQNHFQYNTLNYDIWYFNTFCISAFLSNTYRDLCMVTKHIFWSLSFKNIAISLLMPQLYYNPLSHIHLYTKRKKKNILLTTFVFVCFCVCNCICGINWMMNFYRTRWLLTVRLFWFCSSHIFYRRGFVSVSHSYAQYLHVICFLLHTNYSSVVVVVFEQKKM